jgi:hypothetical protein
MNRPNRRRRQIRPAATDERQHREGNSLELDQTLIENTKRIEAAKGGEGVEPGMPEHALGEAGGLRDGAELSLRLRQEPDGSQLFARRAMGIGRRGKRQAKRAGDPAIIMDQPDQGRSGITGDSMGYIFRCDTQLYAPAPRHSRGRGRLVRPLHLPRPEHSKDACPSQIPLRLDRNVKA